MKKTIITIIIISTIFMLYFLNSSQGKKSDIMIIEECLSLLYNVEDSNELDQYIDSHYLTQMQKQYNKFSSEDGLDMIMKNRIHLLYREVAKNGKLTIELKNIELKKMWVNEKDGSVLNKYKKVGYEYKVELLTKYTQSGESETIYEEGYINLVEIDEEWKVDLVKYKVLNNIFENFLYIKQSI